MKIIKYILIAILAVGLLAVAPSIRPKVDQQQLDYSMDMSNFGFNTQREVAQTFKPSVSANIYSFTFYLNSYGNPTDQLKAQIFSDGITAPGILLATSINNISVGSIQNFYTFTFPVGIKLAKNVTYWVVISRTGSISETNFYTIWGNDEASYDPYARGTIYFQTLGDTWFDYSYPPTAYADTYFVEKYVR